MGTSNEADISPATPPSYDEHKVDDDGMGTTTTTTAGAGDMEKHGGQSREPELKRRLKSRHLQMIAIGMFCIFLCLLRASSCVCC